MFARSGAKVKLTNLNVLCCNSKFLGVSHQVWSQYFNCVLWFLVASRIGVMWKCLSRLNLRTRKFEIGIRRRMKRARLVNGTKSSRPQLLPNYDFVHVKESNMLQRRRSLSHRGGLGVVASFVFACDGVTSVSKVLGAHNASNRFSRHFDFKSRIVRLVHQIFDHTPVINSEYKYKYICIFIHFEPNICWRETVRRAKNYSSTSIGLTCDVSRPSVAVEPVALCSTWRGLLYNS